jgi:hypothetical protein
MRLGGQRHAPAALPPGTETRHPLYRRVGMPPGPVGTAISPPIGVRSPDRAARSDSLYRLSYPLIIIIIIIIILLLNYILIWVMETCSLRTGRRRLEQSASVLYREVGDHVPDYTVSQPRSPQHEKLRQVLCCLRRCGQDLVHTRKTSACTTYQFQEFIITSPVSYSSLQPC